MNLICGINPVLEALAAGTRHFDRLLVVKGIRNRRVSEAIARASQMGVPLRFEARETLDRMAGGVPHQGVIAVVSAKPVISLERCWPRPASPRWSWCSTGSRTRATWAPCCARRVRPAPTASSCPNGTARACPRRVARSSAGALEHVKVARVGNVAQAIEALKARGPLGRRLRRRGHRALGRCGLQAAHRRSCSAAKAAASAAWCASAATTSSRCRSSATSTSLNVSVVAGIALYEVVRQRGVGAEPREADPTEALARPRTDRRTRRRRCRARPRRLAPYGRIPRRIDDEDGEHDEAPTRGLVDIHEEAAWGGPTVVKHRDHDQRSNRLGGQHHRRGDRGPRREGPPREHAAAARRAGEPPLLVTKRRVEKADVAPIAVVTGVRRGQGAPRPARSRGSRRGASEARIAARQRAHFPKRPRALAQGPRDGGAGPPPPPAPPALRDFLEAFPLHSLEPFGTVGVCRWRSSAVERLICNQRVGGSIPSASSNRGDRPAMRAGR